MHHLFVHKHTKAYIVMRHQFTHGTHRRPYSTYLDDEIADDSAIIGVHAGAESVENTGNSNFNFSLTFIRIPIKNTWK